MAQVKITRIDCNNSYPNKCKTIIEIVKDHDVRVLDADYYTKCRRCDADIPVGLKEFCSVSCEYGLSKT